MLSELRVETLIFLGCMMVCNLAVLVALQVQVSEVGARTHKVSGEVEDERKKEEEGKTEEERMNNSRKTRREGRPCF